MVRLVCFFLLISWLASAQRYTDLNLALKHAAEVQELDLSNQVIPKDIPWEQFTGLNDLSLNNCGLTELPPNLERCANLSELNIANNTFLDGLALFNRLQKFGLKSLNISNCKLLFIPASVEGLTELEEVDLSKNGIHQIPIQFGKLKSLKHVDFSFNFIDTIPVSWLNLEKLEFINFSFNQKLEQKAFFQVASTYKNLQEVVLQGMDTILTDINYLSHLKSLDISYGTFSTIPTSIIECEKLEKLRFINHYADWGKVFESLATMTQLNDLEIGGCGFKTLPFNVFKIKRLSHLRISESVITRIPQSIARSSITGLHFKQVGFSNFKEMWSSIQGSKLQEITFQGMNLSSLELSPTGLDDLKRIELYNVNASGIKLQINQCPDFKEMTIINSILDESDYKTLKGSNKGIAFNWQNQSSVVVDKPSHQTPRSHFPIGKVIRQTVYGRVGLLIDLNAEMKVHVPPMAFLDLNGAHIMEEVDVHVQLVQNPVEYALEGFNFQTKVGDDKFASVQPKMIMKVSAYVDGEKVEIDESHPIEVIISKSQEALQLFFYNDNNQLMSLGGTMVAETGNCDDYFEDGFLKYAHENWSQRPRMKNTVRTSKIFISLKKYSKRRNFYYFIEPEYGFNEKQLALLGNKIKAYPEFKYYKTIRWNYVGKNQEADFEKIFLLSEKADKSQIKKRSSFKVYVMSLENIQLYPSKTDDHYVMRFSRGFDTLELAVMPQLAYTKARKIQKWHRKKFVKYLAAYKKRNIRWNELDSINDLNFRNFELSLNNFRTDLLRDYRAKYHEESSVFEHYVLQIRNDENHLIGHFDQQNYNTSTLDLTKQEVVYLVNTSTGEVTQNQDKEVYYLEGNKYLIIRKKGSELKLSIWKEGNEQEGELKLDVKSIPYHELLNKIEDYVENN